MTSFTGSTRGGFWEIWKSQLSWRPDTEREGSTFGARKGQRNLRTIDVARYGGWWKRQNRKNVYLSPYVEEKFRTWTKKS